MSRAQRLAREALLSVYDFDLGRLVQNHRHAVIDAAIDAEARGETAMRAAAVARLQDLAEQGGWRSRLRRDELIARAVEALPTPPGASGKPHRSFGRMVTWLLWAILEASELAGDRWVEERQIGGRGGFYSPRTRNRWLAEARRLHLVLSEGNPRRWALHWEEIARLAGPGDQTP